MRQLGWTLLVLLVAASSGPHAWASKTFGNEDPFPLSCIDFSGKWRSDEGEQLTIVQDDHCRWLRVTSSFDSQNGPITIVPDDKDRIIVGGQWRGTIRHRWNDKKFATVIETHRTLTYTDKTVTELVLLEKVNANLLLESTFRKTEPTDEGSPNGPPPTQERSQRVFRYQSPGYGWDGNR